MSEKFTFGVDDPSVLLSHLALESKTAAETIAKTRQWKEEETLTAEVYINGVRIPAESFENLLQHWVQQIEKQMGFLDKAEAVEDAARHLLEEKKGDLLNRMKDLEFALNSLTMEIYNG